jgi:hypothetical protein
MIDVTVEGSDKTKQIDIFVGDLQYTFNLSRKRIFLSTIPSIVDDFNTFLPRLNEEDLIELLELKSNIDDNLFESDEEIIASIKECFCKESIKTLVVNYVKEQHTISIEAADKNEELQFTDSMARMVICISIFCRLIIPFLSHYMFIKEIKKEDTLFFEGFALFYSFFDKDDNGESIDISSKINKLVSTNVDNTLYSDKVIWNYLQNISVNPKIMTIELFKRVIKDIIPKITINKSIISFLHVVLKKQIKFQFTQNIKINYKPITAIKTDNETGSAINPFTKIEQKLVRTNEMDYLIQKETIQNFIKSNSVLKVKAETEYYCNNVVINPLQIKIINFYISKVAGSGINIFLCNRREFIELLMITHRFLVENKFNLLSKILLSTPIEKETVKNFNKGNLLTTIIDSKMYDKILKKYNILEEKIREGKIIISFVSDILNTEFDYFPLYKEPKNSQFSVDEVPLKLGIAEILSFIERI